MAIKSTTKSERNFYSGLIFHMEQWMALPLGIACLAVFVWAALDGHEAFSTRHLSHFSATTLVFIGWFLTCAVGVCGVTLTKFAFYRQSEQEPEAKSPSGSGEMVRGSLTESPNRLNSTVAGTWRR